MVIEGLPVRLVVAICGLSLFPAAGLAKPRDTAQFPKRRWVVSDIVQAPWVDGLAISNDGRWAACIVRHADLKQNREISVLREVRLSDGFTRTIAKSGWIESIAAVPGTHDWSILADFGKGVQLYRLNKNGGQTPVLFNADTVLIGRTTGAVWSARNDEPPLRFGVLGYKWSPDGHSLWYVRSRPGQSSMVPISGERVRERFATPYRLTEAEAEIRLRVPSGKDFMLARRPFSDYSTVAANGYAVWNTSSTEVRYETLDEDAAGIPQTRSYFQNIAGGVPQKLEGLASAPPSFPIPNEGPFGGVLASSTVTGERHLVERLGGVVIKNWGPVDFRLSEKDPRLPASQISLDGRRAVVGVRHIDQNVRSDLLILEANGRRQTLAAKGGITACAFTAMLDTGVCVEEGMNIPPTLVRVDFGTAKISRLTSLAPEYEAIEALDIEPRVWTGDQGLRSTGFIVYPRDYVAGRRYPTIVVVHGTDADQRFLARGFEWQYPIPAFAERGYLVLCINDPFSGQSAAYDNAAAHWTSPASSLPPNEVQNYWFSRVRSLEKVVSSMAAEGLVDQDHVGIAGYSAGSQIVNVAMTQSHVFKVASSGDGGYLEPAAYYGSRLIHRTYNNVYGGSPYLDSALENYRRLSPTFRAREAAGPILQQVAGLQQAQVEFYDALRSAGVPAEISIYPGETPSAEETHVMHIPSNILWAMSENLDWFDFWLKGVRDLAPAKASRYERWYKMATSPLPN